MKLAEDQISHISTLARDAVNKMSGAYRLHGGDSAYTTDAFDLLDELDRSIAAMEVTDGEQHPGCEQPEDNEYDYVVFQRLMDLSTTFKDNQYFSIADELKNIALRGPQEVVSISDIDTKIRKIALLMWHDHYREESPNFSLFDSTDGVLSQIDNMLSGLTRKK